MLKLQDKIALVTGGTSGIGEAIAKIFAKEGATVIIVGRNETRGNKVVSTIEAEGGKALFIKCDVSKSENVSELKAEFLKHFSKLDILVNSAGILKTCSLEELAENDLKDVFSCNAYSAFFVTSSFVDLIVESKGNILTNASIDGLQSLTRGRATYLYAPSKASVIQFMKIVALNYTKLGVRVNCICPGVTETSLFTNRDFSRFEPAIPMGRVAQPIEIAKAALFLCSDDASYVSGAVLTVDGGASLL